MIDFCIIYDIDILAADYFVEGIWAVDMFPETGHVESVVLIQRKVTCE